MTSDVRETILLAARQMAQAHGYNGLSFRELAKKVGVKSASIHYHFPTKADLGAVLMRRYTEDAEPALEGLRRDSSEPAQRLRDYVDGFRRALEDDNRMCLCGAMAAEYDDLPELVKIEVQGFVELNVAWLAKVLSSMRAFRGAGAARRRALAIFAAINGAQLVARGRGEIAAYDQIVETYRAAGLIPA